MYTCMSEPSSQGWASGGVLLSCMCVACVTWVGEVGFSSFFLASVLYTFFMPVTLLLCVLGGVPNGLVQSIPSDCCRTCLVRT